MGNKHGRPELTRRIKGETYYHQDTPQSSKSEQGPNKSVLGDLGSSKVEVASISTSSSDDHRDVTTIIDTVTPPADNYYVFDCMALTYGDHEVEESDEGGSDLHRHKAECKKNPGHTHFIPAPAFTVEHLPQEYQVDPIYRLIKLQARLTVKISSRCVSPERPEFYPDSNDPYPFYKRSGVKFTRNGTGMIWEVVKYIKKDNKPCPCDQCRNSTSPMMSYAYVRIQTAAHVVYDQIEAQESVCVIGYDSEDGSCLEVGGLIHYDGEITADESFLICYVHDEDLVNSLVDAMADYELYCQMVSEVYWPYRLQARLTVIVSHPHGYSKQISIGEWTQMNRMYKSDNITAYNYTSSTCPGSSGAYVYIMGKPRRGFHHAHMGVNRYGNHSGIGID